MILENVPSPGYIPCAHQLRKLATTALSSAEIQLSLSPGSDIGDDLRKFFLGCADLCPVKVQPIPKKVTK